MIAEVTGESRFMVYITYESGRSELIETDSFTDVAKLKADCDSGMTGMTGVSIFVRVA